MHVMGSEAVGVWYDHWHLLQFCYGIVQLMQELSACAFLQLYCTNMTIVSRTSSGEHLEEVKNSRRNFLVINKSVAHHDCLALKDILKDLSKADVLWYCLRLSVHTYVCPCVPKLSLSLP